MNKEQLGQFIKQQRIIKNLTQQELADEININRQSIVRIENGQGDYGIDIFLEIIQYLGFTLVPTVSNTHIPSKIGFNFSLIRSATEKDDPNYIKRKKEIIFTRNKKIKP